MKITYAKQDINQDDIDAVIDVLQSPFLTQGPKIQEFEGFVANKCGSKFAYAVNSATSALHLSLLAIGACEDDVVWTTPNSFVATANSILYTGASVDFVDISKTDFNMCVESLEEKLKNTTKTPKAVIPVAFGGKSCNMKKISDLSQQYGFKVIEDASHAIGGSYDNSPIGSCRYADVTIFSFHPVKIITTGEGGMLLTSDEKIAHKVSLLRTHGVTRDRDHFFNQSKDPLYYEQQLLGYNYRMTEMQAALGLSQAKRLDEFIARRHVIANRYIDGFDGLPVTIQQYDAGSAYHLFVMLTENKGDFIDHLRNNGIFPSTHYPPIYLQEYYKTIGFEQGLCQNAEWYYARSTSLPMYTKLTDKEQEHVINTITHYFNHA